jgi:hypothetical protein
MAHEPLDPTLVENLRRLDDSVNTQEDTSIRARWDYGRCIRVFYQLRPFGERKQLRKGVLDTAGFEPAFWP